MVDAERRGNLVVCNFTTTTASPPPQADGTSLGEIFPIGYRPSSGTVGSLNGAMSVGSNASRSILIQSNGSMSYFQNGGASGATRWFGNGLWFTDDPLN